MSRTEIWHGRPISFTTIGHIENEFDEPTNSESLRAATSRIVIDPALTDGLRGLEPGGRVMVGSVEQ